MEIRTIMEKICDRNVCTGCGLCKNICPKNAIKMIEAEDTGHFVPQIDKLICVDCKLCQKKCPGLKENEHKKQLKTFAAWKEDISDISGSSSGGVAAAFYEKAIETGYYIVGTYLDDKFRAKMKVTNDINEVSSFKGSKYIQADAQMVYKDCLDILKNGNKILFIGTPCQCAAMRSMAEETFEDKLLTVELICHGTPSQKSFHDYIYDIEKRKKRNITKVAFRSSWGVELSLYSGDKVFWKYKGFEDDYMVAFQKGMLHNLACYECKYANRDRSADITIGDFWKLGEKIPFNKPKCKVSVIVANNEKGLEFINECDNLQLYEREYEEAINGNPNLYRPSTMHPMRDIFWKIYHEEGVFNAYHKTIGKNLRKIRFKNKIKNSIKNMLKTILRK